MWLSFVVNISKPFFSRFQEIGERQRGDDGQQEATGWNRTTTAINLYINGLTAPVAIQP